VAAVFDKAVAAQCLSDVPIGAFLSGGVDSSAVVAAMVASGNRPKQTYCIGFDGPTMQSEGFGDDLAHARVIARQLDVPLTEIRVGEMAPEGFEQLAFTLDEPQADPAALYVGKIAEAARADSIKVLLGGTGGDDIFSGYRAFTRDCVQQIPITARGFDVETELTLQALYRGLVIKEVPAPYRARPEGSFSKLNTFSDGFRVLLRLFLILKSYKPLTFFGSISILLGLFGLAVGSLPVYDYLTDPNHFVHRVPSAILAAALMIMAFFSLGLGLILNSVNLRLLELEKLITKR